MGGAARLQARAPWGACALALLLLTPSALAVPVQIRGDVETAGPATALFVLGRDGGASWSVAARVAILDRHFANFTSVSQPLGGPVTFYDKDQHETLTLSDATLVGSTFGDGAQMLAWGSGASLSAFARGAGLAIQALDSPTLEGGAPRVDSGDGAPQYAIHERILGRFVGLTPAAGDVELRGTMTLLVFGADFLVASSQGSFFEHTGSISSVEGGPASVGRIESARLTLVDAVLTLRQAPAPLILANSAKVTYQGALSAPPDVLAALPAELSRSGATGALEVSLGEAGLHVESVARAPGAGLVPSDAASWAWVGVTLASLTAIALVAFAIARRRRAKQDDDLAEALLAMDQGRHADALAHLGRVLERLPHDALVNLDIAVCLEALGRLDEARRQYEVTLALAPANAEALYYYARTLAKLRSGPESEAHLADALVLDPRLEEMAAREPAFRQYLGVDP